MFADAVQRVAFAAAVAVDLLLHPAPDLVHGLGAELDDVEGIKHRGGVFELFIDRVLVPMERVQRGYLHTGAESLGACGEPVHVGLAGTARDQVQQPGLP